MTDLNNLIAEAVGAHGIEARTEGGAILATVGRGPRARKVTLDPAPLVTWLETHPDTAPKQAAAGFASGVRGVLGEPVGSEAKGWDFVQSAGRLTPSIEHRTFALGVFAADGQAPWIRDFGPDLCVAYTIELDRGVRVLTQAQFDGWGTTPDRVTSASRSLLYYKTAQDAMHGDFEPHAPSGGQKYALGDGCDAARALILQDLDYHRTQRGLFFALPHQDLLLVRNRTDDAEARARFSDAVQAAFETADYPLSSRTYTYDKDLQIQEVSA